MVNVINGETPIAVLTVSQLLEVVRSNNDQFPISKSSEQNKNPEFVYGIRGIRDLFGVSHTTAWKYKDTFLKPAIRQHGRKIVVERQRALDLFDEYNKK